VKSQVAFFFFAVVTLIAAWRVVSAKDIMRSALALVVVLGAMAPLFILLAAEFIAVVQLLVYVGAVVILFLFGIMLTRAPTQPNDVADRGSFDNALRWPGAVISIVLFLVLWFAIRNSFGGQKIDVQSVGSTAVVGRSLLTDHVFAFEAVSVLLLVALVGAIVLARRES
jgi:NADH-quinone oxidoreductase subunit J